ncbi:MAG TPA: MotA/TolQ/ExbB proton channel family protein [Rhabdochlamydiaceae bacterium]|nr:MotA/TolQ/ExbB proton channel family protein [Rhabdochlamydiaceae bacterium]
MLASVFFSAYSHADFFGKLILAGLFSLSILCWVVLIAKVKQTKKVKKMSSSFEKAFQPNISRLLALSIEDIAGANTEQPFGKIFLSLKQKTLDLLNKNHFFATQEKKEIDKSEVYLSQTDLEIIESHVLTTISSENKNLEKHLFILSTIVTLAPFIGLLGTVWGILISFSEMQSGATVNSSNAVLGGLATALVSTVLGLVIAIPALVSYNYLKNNLKHYSSDMEDFLYRLLSTIELQYRKPF